MNDDELLDDLAFLEGEELAQGMISREELEDATRELALEDWAHVRKAFNVPGSDRSCPAGVRGCAH